MIKVAVSNIAWKADHDYVMYDCLQRLGINGLEIAPTRLFEEFPYKKLTEARAFSKNLLKCYNLHVASMQSIWYGRTESIFGTKEERDFLLAYTKEAIDFAASMNCENIVFGCPKNRNMLNEDQEYLAEEFFCLLNEYADKSGVYISIEANPEIYGTNFLTHTNDAINFVKKIGKKYIRINYDFGTVRHNEEEFIKGDDWQYINHIHISEPFLGEPVHQKEYEGMASILVAIKYKKYVSLEMKDIGNIEKTKYYIEKIRQIF